MKTAVARTIIFFITTLLTTLIFDESLCGHNSTRGKSEITVDFSGYRPLHKKSGKHQKQAHMLGVSEHRHNHRPPPFTPARQKKLKQKQSDIKRRDYAYTLYVFLPHHLCPGAPPPVFSGKPRA
jgi:hypothetical protein